jgi:hypothetical protein
MSALSGFAGPGIITANVDNDAGGITTYSLAGAQFGMSLLWMMLPTTVALVVVQEMCARMGAVTGKGLSDLIRERFGVKITFYVMIALLFDQHGQHRERVRGHRRQHGAFRRQQVCVRAAGRRGRVAAHRQGLLPHC